MVSKKQVTERKSRGSHGKNTRFARLLSEYSSGRTHYSDSLRFLGFATGIFRSDNRICVSIP